MSFKQHTSKHLLSKELSRNKSDKNQQETTNDYANHMHQGSDKAHLGKDLKLMQYDQMSTDLDKAADRNSYAFLIPQKPNGTARKSDLELSHRVVSCKIVIKVPNSLQKLLLRKESKTEKNDTEAKPVLQHKIMERVRTHSVISSTPSSLGPSFIERVGIAFHPLSNVRTAYQDHELCKRFASSESRTVATPPRDDTFFLSDGDLVKRIENYFLLDQFDNDFNDSKTPQEWVAMGGTRGTPALSRYYNTVSKSTTWEPCRVMRYDKDTQCFLVRWQEGKTKWTRRLNIIFDDENVDAWQQRVECARICRQKVKNALYQRLYLEVISNDAITPFDQDQMDRIITKIAPTFPLQFVHIIDHSSSEVEMTYCTTLKKTTYLYNLRTMSWQERLEIAKLPPLKVIIEPSFRNLKGTIDVPPSGFKTARAKLSENLFQIHPLLRETLYSIHNLWKDYEKRTLCLVSLDRFDKTPIQLQKFMQHQAQEGATISEKLRGEWISAVLSTIQSNLDPHFNFYTDNFEEYKSSRICRFIRLVNNMMATQLRGLLMQSLENFTTFIESYRIEYTEDDSTMRCLLESSAESEKWKVRYAELSAKRKEVEGQAQVPEVSKNTKKKFVATASGGTAGVHGKKNDEARNVPFSWCAILENNYIPCTKRVMKLTTMVNDLRPLFAVKLVEHDGTIVFQPLLEEVINGVMQVFENCFEYCGSIDTIGDQLLPLLSLQPAYLKPLVNGKNKEQSVCSCRQLLHQVLEENLEAPLHLQQMYSEFDYILKANLKDIMDDAVVSVLSLDEFELVFERLDRDLGRIKKHTSNNVKYELFAVSCQEIKTVLTRKAKSLLANLMDFLSKRLLECCTDVIRQYEEMFEKISVYPTTPEELQDLRVYIDGVAKRSEDIGKDFDWITKGNELLLRFCYLVPEDNFNMYWVAAEWPKKLQDLVEERTFQCKEYRAIFIQNLRDNCERLACDIMQLGDSVDRFAHLGDYAHADEFYERSKEIEVLINTYQDQMTLYNSHEELFGLATSQYPQLKDVKTQFEPCSLLWKIASHFNAESEGWLQTRLSALNPVDVDQKVSDWDKTISIITKKIKEMEPKEALKQIKANIERFKPNIPLLYALHSNLQATHWKAIYQQCGIAKEKQGFGTGGTDMNDQRPLGDFLKLGLLEYLPQIENIASVARKTHEIETDLMSMENEWKKILFEMEPYQNTYKLKANDTMQLTLDEHILKTQSMLSKPIVRQAPALQARVSQWAKQFENIQCTMDEWFRCQNTWSYLEPIFSSSDISRSLPNEKQLFMEIYDIWKEIMEHTRTLPQVFTRCQDESLLKTFSEANNTLEEVMRKLQEFLETKRMAFPRFYFISNEELLQILSDSRDPFLVQPYLCKFFEGVKRIKFSDNQDIVGMESSEGEKVPLVQHVNPADYGNQVELWLQMVEQSMKATIRDQLRQAIGDYTMQKHVDFVRAWPGQVVIAICSLYWTMEATRALQEEGTIGLSSFYDKCTSQLDDLIILVRDKNIKPVERCTLEALVVIEVHSKDIIGMLCEKGVDNLNSFDWIAQLHYYWTDDHLTVQQINASFRYGYEYLGNTGRLVITPLTDRCYRTLLGALHLNHGGAPEGPAGTGKTETTKDLAKALGKYCVVYNCSDQISAKDMVKLFKGLIQAGAWGCFDEFNRIEIQVLSVIAQQIATIQDAIVQKQTEFIFDGTQIRLDPGCAIFVTMNPGYAGRAELPDNLKALFRPVAMMVPNYAMIGEIQLYSYGFLNGKVLAEKIVATYRLCSEQLSSQDHYDYGMRAVKAVLTAAGRLKRTYPDENEMILTLRSIQDVNLPKFLSQDVELFKAIVSDLFPDVVLPDPDYMDMHKALQVTCRRKNIQLTKYFEEKIRQTYEMICVRHGMMIVGYSYGGKTKVLQCLSEGLTEMEASGKELRTRMVTINPKSITMAQLYGKVEQSGEWTDGVLSNRFRQLAQDVSSFRKWLVLDGPVDALWIENMNTVLDDNKKLCLQNGDIVPMSKAMNLIFEVQDLAHASPATVSRCGMVYVEPQSLGWRCLIDSFMNTVPEYIASSEALANCIRHLTDAFMQDTLDFVNRHTTTIIPQGDSTAVSSFIKLFDSFLRTFDITQATEKSKEPRLVLMRIEGWFLFSLVWSVGGCLLNEDRQRFSDMLHRLIEEKLSQYKFTITLFEKNTLFYDMKFEDGDEVKFVDWMTVVPELVISKETEYQDIIVPTSETSKYTFLMQRMISSIHPALLVGDTGTGKTIMMKSLLKSIPGEMYSLNMIQLSAQTSSSYLQRLIDDSCEKRRKGYYGPPINKKMLVFIDDVNLPKLEEYGAQPPIELVRQYLDHGAWYSHSKESIELRHLVDLLLLCAMGPAGGGRNPITPRFTRHFNTFSIPAFCNLTLKKIFNFLAEWILSRGFSSSLRSQSNALVSATVDVYETLRDKLKPSPEKSHYTFNLRDMRKVFQGIDMAYAPLITSEVKLAELWVHEVSRAFADRFTENGDNLWFDEQMAKICQKYFKLTVPSSSEDPLIFSTIMNEEGRYEKISSSEEARRTLELKVNEFNTQSRTGDLNLVVFNYVLEHVTRICRVLKQPGGNLLLIGVGGSGRRSCTRLAAYLQECDYATISAAKEYGYSDFLDDIRQLLLKAGQKGYSTVFVLSDSQITSDTFLEDICSLFNTGEVPGLWSNKQDKDIYENAVASLRDLGKNLGRPDTTEALQNLFAERCQKHLHIVLCFSPLGNVLRDRLRKFPSLVNCTSIDWFRDWPEEGLSSVAERFLDSIDLTETERATIRDMLVLYQLQVRDMSTTYLTEARQHTYVTPTSYLDLLSTFGRLLKFKRDELTERKQRYTNGLDQLKKTEDQVEVMQNELALLKPELAEKQKQTNELIQKVEQEGKISEQQRAIVAIDEKAANEQAVAAKKMKDTSQAKVDEAHPLVEQALRAVLDLDQKALQEVKALKTPPQGVKFVIEVLCTLLGGQYKPKSVRDPLKGVTNVPYWEHAKTTLLTGEFNNILLNSYPVIVDNAPNSQIEEVKKKMANDMFKMENIRKTSVALVGVATYIKAVVEYYQQNKIIKPLLAQAAAAEEEYNTAMNGLNKKKEELRIINEKLQALTAQLEQVNTDKQNLEAKINDTDTKLTRAKKLIEGLGGEKARFLVEAQRAEEALTFLVGNVLVTAGVLAYMGPFLDKYRRQAIISWVKLCKDKGIPVSNDFSLENFCGNPIEIQEWKLQQLPVDSFSVSNAVIMKNSSRFPLLVDPQQQANNWIRNLEREHQLVVIQPSESNYIQTIRNAISEGRPVLLENVEETIDPVLDNLLLKRLTKEGTMVVLHLGEPVEWNSSFRFYMTTKLPRPHYLPEVSTKVTLINFMITEKGLEDQLLQRVMMSERRDVEEKKNALTLEAAANKAGLKSTEDRILSILSSDGNILESEEAIEELDYSKEQSDRIAKRQEEIEAMERISDRTRNLFVPVAHLGAILFFCVSELANIDPMYQNSVQFYISIFQEALVNSERSPEVSERTEHINTTFKKALYERICRSLFAKDQLLFSFIMSLKIFEVDPILLRWLLMGGFEQDLTHQNPFPWLPQQNWAMLCRADTQLTLTEESLVEIVKGNESFFNNYYDSSRPLDISFPPPLDKLSSIEQMVLVRCFRTDKIVPAVANYVRDTLGDVFLQPPLYALETIVDELVHDPSVPIILVLSPGADPNAELDRVADLKGMGGKCLHKLSLGQGQEAPARALIESSIQQGHWVLLQNCHLHQDFMPQLSNIIENYSDLSAKQNLNPSYRLWLTSLPSETFPIAILQNGVKLVQEPPAGLKSNLMQSYLTDPIADDKFFTSSNKPEEWQKLLFGLCFFHAVIQGRRQYGPLGWNRPYEFNDTDRRISIRQLNMFINENESVPYDALLYLIGECNYGGRVTDDLDRRCLMATLQLYITPLILDNDYNFCSDVNDYYSPPFGEYGSFVSYIESLPMHQHPSIFGLHENADITKDEREARFLLDATLATQPVDVGSTSSGSSAAFLDPKVAVKQIANDIFHRLPKLFDLNEIQEKYPFNYAQSMNTVLLQEVIRYNRLLDIVQDSLVEVQDAISGHVVMSSKLEQVFRDIYDNKVPELWRKRSYPTLKALGSYVNDFIARLLFLRRWIEEGPPAMFWLSGFFFTQSFLTGVMQNYARKYHIEIDKLVWNFTVMDESSFDEAPQDGCYIYGLFLEGAGCENGVLTESKPKELFLEFPILRLVPSHADEIEAKYVYRCPCYKTTDRKGVLSTTGHSTNFILTINLPIDPIDKEDHWVLRGVALFTQVEY
ncbi:unnamed protein product [Phytomonas sp. Hart1]|nr:unnamed protein product [Phytomonas sp. Hart1]|eukprot:CCW70441.1 unnamed protein product [Phytomonas sp. isolate Hart1]